METAKRSAAMAPLSKHEVDRILDELHRLTRERQQITTILSGLPPSMHQLRQALNELAVRLDRFHGRTATEAPSGGTKSTSGRSPTQPSSPLRVLTYHS